VIAPPGDRTTGKNGEELARCVIKRQVGRDARRVRFGQELVEG
jgi:hypothetical protein